MRDVYDEPLDIRPRSETEKGDANSESPGVSRQPAQLRAGRVGSAFMNDKQWIVPFPNECIVHKWDGVWDGGEPLGFDEAKAILRSCEPFVLRSIEGDVNSESPGVP